MSRIYLSPPHLSGLEKDFLLEALDSNWIAPLGPQVDSFEEEIVEYLGVKAAVALSSGTAALHLALRISGVQSGDFVLCPSLTFSSTANVILYEKATPVFLDSDPEGIIQFEINFSDSSGNEGDAVSVTTNNSNVILDKTPPIGFTVGDVSSTGGNVVNSIWNLTNTGLDLIIPIDSDSTLDSGRVQIRAKIGSNIFETLGALSFIESNEIGSTKTISIAGDLVRALTGYVENDTISFDAIIYDIPGNEVQGIESTTKLLIDETPPSLITVSYESDFSDFDEIYVFGALDQIRILNGWFNDQVGSIEVFLNNSDNDILTANKLYNNLPSEIDVITLKSKYANILLLLRKIECCKLKNKTKQIK